MKAIQWQLTCTENHKNTVWKSSNDVYWKSQKYCLKIIQWHVLKITKIMFESHTGFLILPCMQLLSEKGLVHEFCLCTENRCMQPHCKISSWMTGVKLHYHCWVSFLMTGVELHYHISWMTGVKLHYHSWISFWMTGVKLHCHS